MLSRLRGFPHTVRLAFEGSDEEIIVREDQIVSTAQGATPVATVRVHPRVLRRLVEGQLEPRAGLIFGHYSVEGTVSAAMQLFDRLAGVARKQANHQASELPRPTTDIARAKADLHRYGYCLVANALSPDFVARLRTRVREQADAEAAAGVGVFDGGPGNPNQRIWNLINKGSEFVELLDAKVVDQFVPDLLGDHFIISSYSANIAGPGGQPQILHCDQSFVQPPVPYVIGLNIAFFLDDVTESNGGTRIMPGSDQPGVLPDDPCSIAGTIAAEGPAGTALIWGSRVYHGTGANVSTQPRHVILLYFNRYFMRAQENVHLSLLPAVKQTLSNRVLTMLGFRCTVTLGGVEGIAEGKMVDRPAAPIGRMTAPSP